MSNPISTLTDDVTRVIEMRNESLRWWQANFYDEWQEVYRSSKCRTAPIMVRNDKAELVEDKARTNVCMPDTAVIIRRNTARLTAQPPTINYICRNNPEIQEKLTAWSYFQYDRSNEAIIQRRHVQQEETFGVSYTKLYWDKLSHLRQHRFQQSDIHDRLPGVLKASGYSEEAIRQEMKRLGDRPTSEQLFQRTAEQGPELSRLIDVKKYEGPLLKNVFVGDMYPEPGFKSLNEALWVVENYIETDRWLRYMKEQTYTHPDTGKKTPVFFEDALREIEDTDIPPSYLQQGNQYLIDRLRSVIGQTVPLYNQKLYRGKRFFILECHELREDDRIWISWIANEKIKLGEMPYPWDLGGRYVYTEFVGLPDLITGVGDSTPRLGRFLQSLHNTVVNQRTDLITNVLRPLVFRRRGADIPDEALERALYRIIDVKDPNDFIIPREPDAPQSAWESENQVVRMFGLLDGALTNIESGTQLNPQGGRTATTAVLQQRALDAMTQYKLDGYNLYLKELYEKKLAMLQQFMEDPADVPERYVRTEALKMDEEGHPKPVTIDPMEIQEDIEVEPEAGSTLAVDDEFHRMAAQTMYQVASQNPVIWNLYEAAKFYAATIKGADVTKLINPPQPPPPPEPKLSATIAVKPETLPPDVQQKLFQMIGLGRSKDLDVKNAFDQIIHTSSAADAAANLAAPVHEQPQPGGPDGTESKSQGGPGKGVGAGTRVPPSPGANLGK